MGAEQWKKPILRIVLLSRSVDTTAFMHVISMRLLINLGGYNYGGLNKLRQI